jgi:DNA polymerase-1
MIGADQWLLEEKPDAKMIMQVHDELVFEAAEDRLDHFTAIIRTIMCSAANLNVPLIVDIGVGSNWDEAH